MRVRIEDRLRDDSCFDASLDGMPTSEAFSRIERRLRVAMPRSRANYVGKHLRTCELVRCSGRILLNAVDAEASVIENAERLLIGSAWALGAHLKNKQHLKFRSPSAIDGCRLATEFVTGLRQHGWTESSVQDWLSALASTAHLK